MSTILWRLVLLGFLMMVVAFFEVDSVTAQIIGQATGAGMLVATLATLWDF